MILMDYKKKKMYFFFLRISCIYIIYIYFFFIIIFVKNFLTGFSVLIIINHDLKKLFKGHKTFTLHKLKVLKSDNIEIGNGMEAPYLEYRKEFLQTELMGVRHMLQFKEQRGIGDLFENLYRGYHILPDHSAYASDLQPFEFSFDFSKTNLKVFKVILIFLKFCMYFHRLSVVFKNIIFGAFWDFCEDVLYLSFDFLFYYSLKTKKDFKIYVISGKIVKDFIIFLKGSPYWIQKIVNFLRLELLELRSFFIFLDKYVIMPINFCLYLLYSVYKFFFGAIHDHLRTSAELRKIYMVNKIQSRLARKTFYKFLGFIFKLTLAFNLFWIVIHIYFTCERLYINLFKFFFDIIVDIFFIIFG